MTAGSEPFFVELNHEAPVWSSAKLIRMSNARPTYDYTTGPRQDANAVDDLDRLAGECQTNTGRVMSVRWNPGTRSMQCFGQG